MADQPTPGVEVMRGRVLGTLLQFDSATALTEAGRKARAAGYKRLDAHTPFPVHGIEDALGIRPTILPWLVLAVGMTFGLSVLGLQYFANATGDDGTVFVGYPFRISGKPLFSIPANIPPTFEGTILGAAFTSFLAMLALNGLPRLFQPLFRHRLWTRVTDDRFLLWVPVEGMSGTGTDEEKGRRLKETAQTWGAAAVENLHDVVERRSLPVWAWYATAIVCAVLSVPPSFVAWNYHATSTEPRIHPIWDMDFQPKFEAQEVSRFFADRRAMRPREPGVMPYDRSSGDVAYEYGIDAAWYAGQAREAGQPVPAGDRAAGIGAGDGAGTERVPGREGAAGDGGPPAEGAAPAAGPGPDASPPPAATPPAGDSSGGPFADGTSPVVLLQPGTGGRQASPAPAERDAQPPNNPVAAAPAPIGDGGAAGPEPKWLDTFPAGIEVSAATAERGRQRYNIYCAICHGRTGFGNGPVAQRASEIPSPNWVQPANFHTEKVETQPIGRIFNTITAGRGKMNGYGAQVPAADRWAIALYVKSLQAAEVTEIKASPAGVPGMAQAAGSSSPPSGAETGTNADASELPAADNPARGEAPGN